MQTVGQGQSLLLSSAWDEGVTQNMPAEPMDGQTHTVVQEESHIGSRGAGHSCAQQGETRAQRTKAVALL